jgi:aspartate/methionine/tyrosine aminotransferase
VHDQSAGYLSPADLAPERTVITSGLSKSLALGGWRIGVARLPDGAYALRERMLAVASEIWSSPAAPVQQAASYAFTEPVELVERVAASRRLHATVVRAVHAMFVAAGAVAAEPKGGFYIYPDLGYLRGRLGVSTSAALATMMLDRYGIGVLPGHAFGDDPGGLRVRVATSLLYGETGEHRLAALRSGDPLALPWIAASLDHLGEALSAMSTERSTTLVAS